MLRKSQFVSASLVSLGAAQFSIWDFPARTFNESIMWSFLCGNQRSEAVVATLLLLFWFSLICPHPSFSCYTWIVSLSLAFLFSVQQMPVRTSPEIFSTSLPESTPSITSISTLAAIQTVLCCSLASRQELNKKRKKCIFNYHWIVAIKADRCVKPEFMRFWFWMVLEKLCILLS